MLLRSEPPANRPVQRGLFLWPAGADPVVWRGFRVPDPNDLTTRRDAEDLPVEEIANAADELRMAYGQMPQEDLARALAKLFGFRGLTKVVAQCMTAGIALSFNRRGSAP